MTDASPAGGPPGSPPAPADGTLATPAQYPGRELDRFRDAVNWKAYLRERLEPFLGESVLEVGAGLGAMTEILCHGAPERWVCLEPDPDLAARLAGRRVSGEVPEGCEVVRGGTGALLPGPRFDSILYVDVLEHVADDREELERAADLLAPGGHLVVLAPAHSFLFSPFDEAVGHYRRYTRQRLLDAAPEDLDVAAARYLDAVGLLASLGNRLLLRSSMPTRRQIRTWDRLMVPLSRALDPLLTHRVGKSVLAVWRRPQ